MESENENGGHPDKEEDVVTRKMRRARKKQLYKAINDQMEFYFSPANLSKARYVATKLEEGNGKIALSEFLTFNKIKSLTSDINVLRKALSRSEKLTVTDDMVALTVPLAEKKNEEDCVIYVERVPPEADHKWISDVFSRYGKIDYISLPKFPKSSKCKGFAFVEFADADAAQKAVNEFKEFGQYLSGCNEPEKLLSYAINEAVMRGTGGADENECANERDQKRQNDKEKSLKRKKVIFEDESGPEGKKLKLTSEDAPSASESNREAEESTDCTEGDGNTDEKKRKNRKKKKKRNKISVEASALQILSKKDWKVLRNKYLSKQKRKMSLLKKKLSQTQKSNVPVVTAKTESTLPDQLAHGLIVKIRTEPIRDLNDFKKQVNAISSQVNFVDAKEGSDTAMVRLASIDDSKAFCEKSPWPEVKILEGDEEEQYWKIIRKNREEKRNQHKKERGKQKLLKKAEKVLGKHIFFDET